MTAIISIGKIENNLLSYLKKQLEGIFKEEFIIAPSIKIPDFTFDKTRNQYHGEEIINYILDKSNLDKYGKVLAITDQDLYIENRNFIFGIARPHERICIISLKRLYQEFHNLPRNEYLFKARALKEAIHELSHLWGAGHCAKERCVMHFSNDILEVDSKESQLCPSCKEKADVFSRSH